VRLVYERRQVIGDRRPQIAVVRKWDPPWEEIGHLKIRGEQ
jgi:hypothetical protein